MKTKLDKNLPGLDVVWFSNPGSPLVSGMSRGVAVSAASGASVVFKVYEYMIQRLDDMSRPIYLSLMWSDFPTQGLLWFPGCEGALLFLMLLLFSRFLKILSRNLVT